MNNVPGVVQNLKMFTVPTIPLQYGDSLSYLEQLYKILDKLNETIDTVNAWTEAYKDYTDTEIVKLKANLLAYIDAQDTSIREDLTNLINEINAKLTQDMQDLDKSVDARIANLQRSVDSQISDLKDLINQYIDYVDYSLSNLRQEVDTKLTAVYSYVDKEIADVRQEIGEIQVNQTTLLNPVNNEYEKLQIVVNSMFHNLKAWALRAQSYNELSLTAQEYDNFNLSAWRYDYLAKWYLREKPEIVELIKSNWEMHDPFTGQKEGLPLIIQQIIQYVTTTTLTAEEYDIKELTATWYDDLSLTSYSYDFFGSTLVVAPETTNNEGDEE